MVFFFIFFIKNPFRMANKISSFNTLDQWIAVAYIAPPEVISVKLFSNGAKTSSKAQEILREKAEKLYDQMLEDTCVKSYLTLTPPQPMEYTFTPRQPPEHP